jgi:hypothetical protein
MALDSSGNQAVDFVWGNFPLQPNDERAATISQTGGSGVLTATITGATSDGKVATFTTSAAHNLSVGQAVHTGTFAIGGTVASPVAGTTVGASTATVSATTVTADTTQKTVTLTTSANHNILPGQVVVISGGTSTAVVYNGTWVAQPGTATTALVINCAAGAVASPVNSTSATVTVYHYDLEAEQILSVPSTTTFTVASKFGYANGAAVTITGAAGSLERIGDASWAQTTKVGSDRLDAALDNHANVEAGWSGYPTFIAGEGNYIVTAVSGDGTTVTYTSQNYLAPGEVVNITGLTASAYNLSGVTVASRTATSFTVTNSANAGVITGQTGKVQATDALTAADGVGLGNIIVPNVLGVATAVALDALKDAGYETANITNTTGVTNTATQPTQINVTTTTAATVTVSGGTNTWPVGTKVTIAAGTGIPTALVGTWTVTGGTATTNLVIAGSGWTVADTGAITPGTRLTGATQTVKTQSVAANAAAIGTGTAITITSWA